MKFKSFACFTLASISFPSVVFSSHLDHWEKFNPIPYEASVEDAFFSDGYFYILGQQGSILRSEDVIHWEYLLGNSYSRKLNALAEYNDQFVAVGDNGTIIYSADGEVWEQNTTTALSTLRFNDVVGGHEGFFAIGSLQIAGESDQSVLYHSVDGIQWRKVEIELDRKFEKIAYGNENYVISSENGIYYSNGVDSWNYVSFPQKTKAYYQLNLAFAHGIFLVQEFKNGELGPKKFYSTDGITWVEINISDLGFVPGNESWWCYQSSWQTTYRKNYQYHVLYYRIIKLNEGWTENWEAHSTWQLSMGYSLDDWPEDPEFVLTGNGIHFVTGGGFFALCAEGDRSMSDPRIGDPSLNIHDLEVFDEQIWYNTAAGWGSSVDGENWNTNLWRSFATHGNFRGRLVKVGDSLFNRDILGTFVLGVESNDEWQITNIPDVEELAFDTPDFQRGLINRFKDKFIAIENLGRRFIESSDGLNWNLTPTDIPIQNSINGLAVGNGVVVLNSENEILVSRDLVDWTSVDLQTGSSRINSLVYFNNTFYIKILENNATYRSIFRSDDGFNWKKVDFSNSINPQVEQQIGTLGVAEDFLWGTSSSTSHFYVSKNGVDFRRLWFQGSNGLELSSYNSHTGGIEYFRGRFWAHDGRKVFYSAPLEIVADRELSNGMKQSNWFGLYSESLETLNHISLGPLETGIDLQTGEFYLISEELGRFHVLSPFHEDALYIYSLDFDRVYFVAKYNDDLTRSTEGDFYDLQENLWTDSLESEKDDYETARMFLENSVKNVRSKSNQAIQYAELKDYTAAHQFLSECKLFYNACVRNAQRTKNRLEIGNPSDRDALLQIVEDKLNEATTLLNEAQNAYNQMR